MIGAASKAPKRHAEAGTANFHPTAGWVTRALIEKVLQPVGHFGAGYGTAAVWEPAAGLGHMAQTLADYSPCIVASDLYKPPGHLRRTHPHVVWHAGALNFLTKDCPSAHPPDWIITNPPFEKGAGRLNLAGYFALRALDLATVGVAMLWPLSQLCGQSRMERLFIPKPPTIEARFVERPKFHPGFVHPMQSGGDRDYLWLVWIKGERPRAPVFIHPCRVALERPEDYDQSLATTWDRMKARWIATNVPAPRRHMEWANFMAAARDEQSTWDHEKGQALDAVATV